jgi:hypothetical protein
MGKLAVGQKARIKFKALPYQEYGSFDGEVLFLSPDAIDPERGLFEIHVTLPREEVEQRTGKDPLGFAAEIDVITGRERLIWKLLGRMRPGKPPSP